MIRISAAGACPRRQQLEAWGVPGLPPWEGSERAFAEGRLHEASIIEWAQANLPGGPYSMVNSQNKVTLADGLVVGHYDALCTNKAGERILVEAKALSRRAFQELRERSVREAHPQYWTQVQLYLAGLGLEVGYLVARNKETPRTRLWDHHYERIEADSDFDEAEIERLRELDRLIQNRIDIEPPFHPSTNWQCRRPWCPYSEHCHPDYAKAEAATSDRSDLLATVETYQELLEEIRSLEAWRDEIRAKLLEEVGHEPAGARVGHWLVRAVERRSERFDTKQARAVLPAETLAQLVKVSTYTILEVREV